MSSKGPNPIATTQDDNHAGGVVAGTRTSRTPFDTAEVIVNRHPHTTTDYDNDDPPLMGPLLRRKKVVSMPLGSTGAVDFFAATTTAVPEQVVVVEAAAGTTHRNRSKQKSMGVFTERSCPDHSSHLVRQKTPPHYATSVAHPNRRKQSSSGSNIMAGVLRRKQVSLDLMGPNDFFGPPQPPPSICEEEQVDQQGGLQMVDETTRLDDETPEIAIQDLQAENAYQEQVQKLFRPLRFAPKVTMKPKRGHGAVESAVEVVTPPPPPTQALVVDPVAAKEAFVRYTQANQEAKLQILSLKKQFEIVHRDDYVQASEGVLKTYTDMKPDEQILERLLVPREEVKMTVRKGDTTDTEHETSENNNNNYQDESTTQSPKVLVDDGIVHATRSDKIKAAFCFLIMLTITVIVTAWSTHAEENAHIQAPIGKGKMCFWSACLYLL
jgi:hypothetical protein